jgi:hypothetical protein
MATVSYNPHEFSLQTKTFEQQAYDSGIVKAKELAQSEAGLKAHRASRKICSEAFGTFEKNIQEAFPYDIYADLISLTLKSRENLFFIDLKERIITIFRHPDEI